MPVPEEVILTFIKDLVINALDSLRDESFQRRVWFRAEGPECSTYVDVAVNFIDRCESIFTLPICSVYLGDENYTFLKKLYHLVDEHLRLTESRIDPDLLEENELMNDPKWREIQVLADAVYHKLTDFIERQNHEIK